MKDSLIKPEIDKITDKISDMDMDQIDAVLVDLAKLQKDVEKTRISAEAKKRKDALSHVESVIGDLGFTLDEVLASGKAKSRPSAPLRYANPDNASETWTGIGRVPNWLKAFIESGRSRDEFLIKKVK